MVAFSPLAEGVLTGKYNEEIPKDSRAAKEQAGQFIRPRLNEENHAKLTKLAEIANGLGVAMSTLALAWCLRRTELSSCIIGASKPQQIKENVAASDLKLDEPVLERISAILGDCQER